MSRRRKHQPTETNQALDDPQQAWALILEYSLRLGHPSGSRFQTNPATFAPRIWIRPGLWRIPEPEDYAAFCFYLETFYHPERIALMAHQLKEPFPSAPHRPANYQLKIEAGDRMALHLFYSAYAAQAVLRLIDPDMRYHWHSDSKASTHPSDAPDEVFVTSDQLEDLVEYEPTAAEQQWELPRPYPQLISNVVGRRYEPPVDPMAEAMEKAHEKRSRPKKKPSNAPAEGTTTVADIAAHTGMIPTKVRTALRKLGYEKPYQWPQDQLEELAAKVKGAR